MYGEQVGQHPGHVRERQLQIPRRVSFGCAQRGLGVAGQLRVAQHFPPGGPGGRADHGQDRGHRHPVQRAAQRREMEQFASRLLGITSCQPGFHLIAQLFIVYLGRQSQHVHRGHLTGWRKQRNVYSPADQQAANGPQSQRRQPYPVVSDRHRGMPLQPAQQCFGRVAVRGDPGFPCADRLRKLACGTALDEAARLRQRQACPPRQEQHQAQEHALTIQVQAARSGHVPCRLSRDGSAQHRREHLGPDVKNIVAGVSQQSERFVRDRTVRLDELRIGECAQLERQFMPVYSERRGCPGGLNHRQRAIGTNDRVVRQPPGELAKCGKKLA